MTLTHLSAALPPSCFPSCVITTAADLRIKQTKQNTQKHPPKPNREKGVVKWHNFPLSVQLQQTWAGRTEWAGVRGKGQAMYKLSFLEEASAHQITALIFSFSPSVGAVSFLQVTPGVWGQKREGRTLQAGKQQKKRGAFKTLLGKAAKQPLNGVASFWGRKGTTSGIPSPLPCAQTRWKFAMSSKINILKESRRRRHTEGRQHHESFRHVEKQVGKPASLSPSTSFWYFLLCDRAGKKQNWVRGVWSMRKQKEKYGGRYQWYGWLRNWLVSSVWTGNIQFRLWI